MDNHFTALLKRFIDFYVDDPLAVEISLERAREDINYEVFGERFEGETRALGLKRAYQDLKERLFTEPSSTDVAGGDSKRGGARRSGGVEAQAAVPELSWEKLREQRFHAFLNKLAWSLEMPRESLDELIAELGWTRDRLADIERDPEWRKKEAEYDFEPVSKQVFLAREFAAWLDVAVAKIEGVEAVSYREEIPIHLRHYLHQAYRCDLYGLDAACAALCGAILQEAIRFKLGVEGFRGLDQAINAAEESGLLTPKAVKTAKDIAGLRNLAAHGNRQFARSAEYRREALVPITRKILDTLFAEES